MSDKVKSILKLGVDIAQFAAGIGKAGLTKGYNILKSAFKGRGLLAGIKQLSSINNLKKLLDATGISDMNLFKIADKLRSLKGFKNLIRTIGLKKALKQSSEVLIKALSGMRKWVDLLNGKGPLGLYGDIKDIIKAFKGEDPNTIDTNRRDKPTRPDSQSPELTPVPPLEKRESKPVEEPQTVETNKVPLNPVLVPPIPASTPVGKPNVPELSTIEQSPLPELLGITGTPVGDTLWEEPTQVENPLPYSLTPVGKPAARELNPVGTPEPRDLTPVGTPVHLAPSPMPENHLPW